MLSLFSAGMSTEGGQYSHRRGKQTQESKTEGTDLWGNNTLNAELHRFPNPFGSWRLITTSFVLVENKGSASFRKYFGGQKVFFFPLGFSSPAGG